MVGANEREKKRHFWEGLCECVGNFYGKDNVSLLEYFNTRVGNRRVNRIIGSFGVEVLNENRN